MIKKTRIEEKDLLNLLLQNSEKGFSILYDNYSAAIFGVICRILNDDALAEDITQEVFVKIWRNIKNYDETKGSLFTWMLNIARNTAIDTYRTSTHAIQRQNLKVENSVSMIDAEYQLHNSLEDSGLKIILSRLKPDQKQLIDMAYFEGYTQAEISDRLGIPLGTVKTRIKAALAILRKVLHVLFILLNLFR